MYTPLSDVDTPPDISVVWRYVDLERLIGMLASNALHLTRLDRFRDTWEGTFPRKVLKAMNENLKRWGSLVELSERFRSHLFASCWHESPYESAGLWDQYSSAGFAIRSTVGRMKEAIRDEGGYYIGRVKYLDFEQDYHGNHPPSLITPAFLKRRNFEHEREVRVVVMAMDGLHGLIRPLDMLPGGISIPVELTTLVEKLYISPSAPPWLIEHLATLLQRFDLGAIPIAKSNIYVSPTRDEVQ